MGSNKKAIVIIIILVIIALVLGVGVLVPASQMKQAEALIANGQYVEVEQLYTALCRHPLFREQAEEALGRLNERRLARSQQDGRYAELARYYESTGEAELAAAAWHQEGERLQAARQYQQAIAAFQAAGEPERAMQVIDQQGDDALAHQDYLTAINCYERTGNQEGLRRATMLRAQAMIGDGQSASIAAMIVGRSSAEVARLMHDALLGALEADPAADPILMARKYGAYLTDTNAQLAYCALLSADGYPLASVYPDGVAVDIDLSACQSYNAAEGAKVGDLSKLLIFLREEEPPALVPSSAKSYKELVDAYYLGRSQSAGRYRVRLMPGLMEGALASRRAASLEECTAYLILDRGYDIGGSYRIPARSGDDADADRCLAYYGAYEEFALYDARQPRMAELYLWYYTPCPLYYSILDLDTARISPEVYTALDLVQLVPALKDPDAPASAAYLRTLDARLVSYLRYPDRRTQKLLIHDTDADGGIRNQLFDVRDDAAWYIPRYAIAQHTPGWFQTQLDGGILDRIVRSR